MSGAKTRRESVKRSITAAFTVAAIAGACVQAQACNPMAGKNYGKHVAPAAVPAAMLARNHTGVPVQAGIVGLWHDVHTASDGTLFLEGYDTWNRDGTENELGNLPPVTGNLCVGTWSRHGKAVDLTAHVAWLYDPNSNFVGTLDITETNKVASDGNSYAGAFEAKFYDTNGNLFQDVTGTTAAERLGQ
jgi:hypothetical protein